MTVRFARQLARMLLVGAAALSTSSTWACDVPVFRYALQFWPAAPYEVTVLQSAPLRAAEEDALQRLGRTPPQGIPRANVTVRLADLTDPSRADLERVWRELGSPAPPLLLLHDLRSRRPIWSGPLTPSTVAKLADSPARREIAHRILEGDSAVWVLLESGDRAKDAAAGALLVKTLRELEQTLELPVVQGAPPLSREDATAASQPPLQIRFSLLTVSRRDAAESVFVQLLLNSEKDLARYASEPMVFPIYGRGRVLYALVGKGITSANLREAAASLVGACSCEAKEENPGTDLLMAADWERRLVGNAEQAAGPQPLVGLATLSQVANTANAAASTPKAPPPEPSGGKAGVHASALSPARPDTPAHPDVKSVPSTPATAPHTSAPARAAGLRPEPPSALLRNMLLALGVIVIAAALLGVLAARRRPEERR